MKTRNYGIDFFRVIACFMVIAIHTFPFSSISPFLDEALTLTVFRVAVPFFFMVTGYFLLGKLSLDYSYDHLMLIKKQLRKLVSLYGWIIVLYLPFSLLNKTIKLQMSLLEIIRVVIFDGTFYHLWYFPATIIGILIVVVLLRKFNFKKVIIISTILYLIGLGGDSWYGVTSQFAFSNTLYSVIFNMMTYTRSGLFFSPIFLCLGALVYRNQERLKELKRIPILLGSLLLVMLFESIVLHKITAIKHDSMYLLLPPVMLFLFIFLLNWKPVHRIKKASEFTLLVYVIHPIFIIILHGISNYIPILKNSIINYIFVVICNFIGARFLTNLNMKLHYKEKN